jgi:PhzF family phenazine biosynthesis protein
MKIPIYQVDAFTISPFKGNPAAVCLLEKARDSAWMQAVAAEMNLSETAFLSPLGDDYELRWFTPKIEVELCGHGTLSAAHILFEFGFYEPDETICFNTKSGPIMATSNRGTIELDMPRRDPQPLELNDVIRTQFGADAVAAAEYGGDLLIVELPNADAVRNFEPNFKAMSGLPYTDLIITAPGDGKYDFVSRFFSPATGINEDPVTGMAHCSLGPYWASKLGKDKFLAYQASPRGGEVWVTNKPERVYIGGKARTVMAGELLHQSE